METAKTTLMALAPLHHLITAEGAPIYCVASSRDQARVLYEAVADFARELDHPNIVQRHLELRWCEDPDEPTVSSRHCGCWRLTDPRSTAYRRR